MASHHHQTVAAIPNELLDVVRAARALADKMDECDPHITDAYFIRAVHVGPYTGPTFGEERNALSAALEKLDRLS